jgi:hypothetical protein
LSCREQKNTLSADEKPNEKLRETVSSGYMEKIKTAAE